MKSTYLLPITLALAACASAQGPQYAVSHPPKGETKIVVYDTRTTGRMLPFTVNEKPCSIAPNGYVTILAKPGDQVDLTYKEFLGPSSYITIRPKASETHYVSIGIDQSKQLAVALASGFGGFIGGSLASNAHGQGKYVFRLGTEEEALLTKHSGKDC